LFIFQKFGTVGKLISRDVDLTQFLAPNLLKMFLELAKSQVTMKIISLGPGTRFSKKFQKDGDGRYAQKCFERLKPPEMNELEHDLYETFENFKIG
jgi:hypothetical protein